MILASKPHGGHVVSRACHVHQATWRPCGVTCLPCASLRATERFGGFEYGRAQLTSRLGVPRACSLDALTRVPVHEPEFLSLYQG